MYENNQIITLYNFNLNVLSILLYNLNVRHNTTYTH